MTREISQRELLILRHSIGLDDRGLGREYRNRFCAGAADLPDCRALVVRGLMVEHIIVGFGSVPVFFVTDAGKRLARGEP